MPARSSAATLVGAHAGAAAFLAQSVARHGGAERWRRWRLTLAPTELTGLLPRLKGVGHTFDLPATAEIEPARARAVFHDYPEPGSSGLYEAGRVALGGDALVEHRSTFRGARKWRRWSPLDALYFFGYALTHYHALPFTLADAELRAWDARRRILTVAFPPSVHTHCAVQSVHFDDSGLIVRHDYVAEIVGGWARGAHFWREYQDVEGFPVATHRRVLARLGRLAVPLVALDARLAVSAVAFE
ncbi:MAG TPA: hypothetical protein VFH68_23750 [Polyangia bacterium]|jgi:hypothetical protein|nr:hypothetical protein [Polyangia bacterium]